MTMIIFQTIFAIGYFLFIVLLDCMLSPVRLNHGATEFNAITFLKHNGLRIVVSSLLATFSVVIANKYPALVLSYPVAMIGSLFGLYVAYKFFKSDKCRNLAKN